ncbi:hypothetical protein pb186bvf_012797 [Paramecium bursaria]
MFLPMLFYLTPPRPFYFDSINYILSYSHLLFSDNIMQSSNNILCIMLNKQRKYELGYENYLNDFTFKKLLNTQKSILKRISHKQGYSLYIYALNYLLKMMSFESFIIKWKQWMKRKFLKKDFKKTIPHKNQGVDTSTIHQLQ